MHNSWHALLCRMSSFFLPLQLYLSLEIFDVLFWLTVTPPLAASHAGTEWLSNPIFWKLERFSANTGTLFPIFHGSMIFAYYEVLWDNSLHNLRKYPQVVCKYMQFLQRNFNQEELLRKKQNSSSLNRFIPHWTGDIRQSYKQRAYSTDHMILVRQYIISAGEYITHQVLYVHCIRWSILSNWLQLLMKFYWTISYSSTCTLKKKKDMTWLHSTTWATQGLNK